MNEFARLAYLTIEDPIEREIIFNYQSEGDTELYKLRLSRGQLAGIVIEGVRELAKEMSK